ncbi:MAG: 3'-5' exonuclease, partial [Chitinophagaceae bacterium]
AFKYVKPNGRVLAVGDPYQSIYGFAGADIESYNYIQEKLKAARLPLSGCFRCPENVITLAQKFRSDITAFTKKDGLIHDIKFNEVISMAKPGNLVICRIKAPLQVLMFQMIDQGIAVEVHEDEVKEFINDLKFIFLPDELNDQDVLRKQDDFFDEVMDRNLESINKRSNKLKDKESKEEFIREEGRLLNSKLEFIKKQLILQVGCRNISELLAKIEKLISGGENAVKLSTIHRAKGLENDSVFILDYNKLPFYRDGQKDWELKQERNLKYVALTRTRKNLYLVNSDDVLDVEEDGSLFDEMEDMW